MPENHDLVGFLVSFDGGKVGYGSSVHSLASKDRQEPSSKDDHDLQNKDDQNLLSEDDHELLRSL